MHGQHSDVEHVVLGLRCTVPHDRVSRNFQWPGGEIFIDAYWNRGRRKVKCGQDWYSHLSEGVRIPYHAQGCHVHCKPKEKSHLCCSFGIPWLWCDLQQRKDILETHSHMIDEEGWGFFGLCGTDPSLALIIQTNPYTTGPSGIISRSVDWSLTCSSMGGCWNQVSTPLRWMWCWFIPTIPAFA